MRGNVFQFQISKLAAFRRAMTYEAALLRRFKWPPRDLDREQVFDEAVVGDSRRDRRHQVQVYDLAYCRRVQLHITGADLTSVHAT